MMRTLPYLLSILILCGMQVSIAQTDPGIEKVYATFSKAYQTLNPDLVRSIYAENASYLTPEGEVQKGLDELMDGFERMFANAAKNKTKLDIGFKFVSRKKIGDMAYDVGYFKVTYHRKSGEVSHGSGKFVTVLVKQPNGDWKFEVDGYSSAPVEAYDNLN